MPGIDIRNCKKKSKEKKMASTDNQHESSLMNSKKSHKRFKGDSQKCGWQGHKVVGDKVVDYYAKAKVSSEKN
jgi:hypothetical protein